MGLREGLDRCVFRWKELPNVRRSSEKRYAGPARRRVRRGPGPEGRAHCRAGIRTGRSGRRDGRRVRQAGAARGDRSPRPHGAARRGNSLLRRFPDGHARSGGRRRHHDPRLHRGQPRDDDGRRPLRPPEGGGPVGHRLRIPRGDGGLDARTARRDARGRGTGRAQLQVLHGLRRLGAAHGERSPLRVHEGGRGAWGRGLGPRGGREPDPGAAGSDGGLGEGPHDGARALEGPTSARPRPCTRSSGWRTEPGCRSTSCT